MKNGSGRLRGPADDRPLRVLHCPKSIAGNAHGLARAERRLGLDSRAVALIGPRLGHEADEILWRRGESPLRLELARWRLFWRAARGFDIVHFNFGQSLMPERVPARAPPGYESVHPLAWAAYRVYARALEQLDLPVLRRIGKGLVVTYQGDDARQADACRRRFEISPADEVEAGYYSPESDRWKRRRIERASRYAHRMLALNPDLLHVLPEGARFMPYAHLDLDEWVPGGADTTRSRPLLVHAPSHRRVKGTRFVLEAVSRLRAEGVDFDFQLVEGIPFTEVRALYERADGLIDQLLCGWYGGLAVEFMALGKPVFCYIREQDLGFIPEKMRQQLPVINVDPSSIYRVLRSHLISERPLLREVGIRSREFVERWHDPRTVAGYLCKEYSSIAATCR